MGLGGGRGTRTLVYYCTTNRGGGQGVFAGRERLLFFGGAGRREDAEVMLHKDAFFSEKTKNISRKGG